MIGHHEKRSSILDVIGQIFTHDGSGHAAQREYDGTLVERTAPLSWSREKSFGTMRTLNCSIPVQAMHQGKDRLHVFLKRNKMLRIDKALCVDLVNILGT